MLLGHILGFDREVDRAVLAIDIDDHRRHRIAFLEVVLQVLDALARHFGYAQVTLDVAHQRDYRALGVDRLHRALHDAVLLMRGDVIGEGVAVHLFDAEGDALALGVDRQHHRLDFVALLVVAHRLLAGGAPGQVRQMHQAVDAARQSDEHAEIGD